MTHEQSNPNQEAIFAPLASEVTSSTAPIVDVSDSRTDIERQVLDVLQHGVEGILTSEGYQAYLKTMSKFHRYSFANSLLIHSQNPDATHVAGYRKWQDMGRQVRKGETSIKIFVPHKRKIRDEQTDEERFLLTGFGIGSVFDIAQTEGQPLPEPPQVIESVDSTQTSHEVNKRLSRFLMDEGLLMESKDFPGAAHGFYNPYKKQIVIRQEIRGGEPIDPLCIQKTKTLAHEASHYLADHKGDVDRRDAEVVAENSAYVAMNRFGMETGDYSFGYVAIWGGDADRLKNNLSEVQRISHVLISAIEGTEPIDSDSDLV